MALKIVKGINQKQYKIVNIMPTNEQYEKASCSENELYDVTTNVQISIRIFQFLSKFISVFRC